LQSYNFAVTEDGQPLNEVFQLAHIALPGICQQRFQRIRGKSTDFRAAFLVEFLEVELDDFRASAPSIIL
jgi:hypothetical protein